MSPIFLMLPGVSRWELVEVDRPDRPLISGRLRPVVRPVTDAADLTPSIPREETQV